MWVLGINNENNEVHISHTRHISLTRLLAAAQTLAGSISRTGGLKIAYLVW